MTRNERTMCSDTSVGSWMILGGAWGHTVARAVTALLLLVLGAGCDRTADRMVQVPPPRQSAEQVKAAPSMPVPVHAQKARKASQRWIRSEVKGANGNELVWTHRPDPSPEKALACSDTGQLTITRLGLDHKSFSMTLRIEQGREAKGAAVPPTVVATVDGCPAPTPKMAAISLDNDGTEGRLIIARGELPRGDLQFLISAFDSATSLYVRHDDTGIEPITTEDLKTTVVRPADPDAGLLETITFLDPDCTGRGP